MDDFQIADEKTIIKLNEEYRKLKLKAIDSVQVLSNTLKVPEKLTLDAGDVFNLRAIQKAIELEKDMLLKLNDELLMQDRGVKEGLSIIQSMLTKMNKLMSCVVLPSSFSRAINDTSDRKNFFRANLDLIEHTNKLLAKNTNIKLSSIIKYIQQKQLQLFSIILPYIL